MNQDIQEINIDTTQLKSSVKNFVAIIISTITVIVSICVATNKITSSIVSLQISFEKQNEMNDQKYQSFDKRLTADESAIAKNNDKIFTIINKSK